MAGSKAASQIVVVLGAGPGLGFSCARIFANAGHPVALLSRSIQKLETLASKIQSETKDDSRARAYAVDATKKVEIDSVFEKIASDWKGKAQIHTAIFNPGGGFLIKPFLETTEEQLRTALDTQTVGGFLFAQAFIRAIKANNPDLQPSPKDSPDSLGNLLMTGATASNKASSKFSAFASSKFGLKAISESVAREYGPQGIHVSHIIVDGMINTEAIISMMGRESQPHSRLNPDDMAQVYFYIAKQPRSCWTFTTDIRPGSETF